ncbi:hypothetical protein C7T94_08705 [Pedobacter yulinensis]|uniref:Uncharacterized protein n=1 Tax=Pedobacter yulinensis TaxID=2126353 RepID=A0A2T3HJU0_9SPHI|nr:hypothetical protein [Pedobacter yulinensis]PST82725.1 hypothetical protein C7T94_08705 [Pedobacter yulinensis]
MKQMNVPEDMKVTVDFQAAGISGKVRELQPLVFKDQDGYRCLLGPDLETGVVGSGETVDAAIADWTRNLDERLASGDRNDELGLYITEMLKMSNKDVW